MEPNPPNQLPNQQNFPNYEHSPPAMPVASNMRFRDFRPKMREVGRFETTSSFEPIQNDTSSPPCNRLERHDHMIPLMMPATSTPAQMGATSVDESTQFESRGNNPICCCVQPAEPYVKCHEVQRRPTHRIDNTPRPMECIHLKTNVQGCEQCCKLIKLDKYKVSLHCSWHHDCLRCNICKRCINGPHEFKKGKPMCFPCVSKARSHDLQLKTIHHR